MQINITLTDRALKALPRSQASIDYTRLGDRELMNLVIQVQRGNVQMESKIQAILNEAEARGFIESRPQP